MNPKHWITPDWPAPAIVHAATTLRTGGVSVGVFNSLNAALHVGDNAEFVRQNRAIIKGMLDLPEEPAWLEQIHGNQVVDAARRDLLQQADASYTNEPGIVCAVMTADCLPLLVCASDGSQVAAIHAGWKGLLAGVICNTLAAMQIPPSPPFCKGGAGGDLLVWLGPAIGSSCFEVGDDVRDVFLQKSTAFSTAFKSQGSGKWLADIYQLARIDLAAMGITEIYGGTFCTFTEEDRFYSYRRDKETGRMATLIWRD
ncbi:MAG: peptidoglycan editing factor PgeF [Methylovulum sp.]|nr:peptidoglycan editing factor PgeF [Methylovulum sp.]